MKHEEVANDATAKDKLIAFIIVIVIIFAIVGSR